MKKVTYILSHINKAITFEWIVNKVNPEKVDLSFILLNDQDSHLEQFLIEHKVTYKRVHFTSKKDYPRCIERVRRELKKWKSDTVHCHMRDANFIGIIAARLANVKNRIYTRHYSTYNHEYHPRAVKMDRFINRMSISIVAISKNVKHVLSEKENVPTNKIHLIHHGFDLEAFQNTDQSKIDQLKHQYRTQESYPVIGVIARYINWKGLKYIIDAAKKVTEKHPNALFIFANANGPDKNEIQALIKSHIPNNYIEIPFEKDLFSLYQLFDIYIHTPINPEIEAFGQTYVEALAAGIPSVFTLSGVGKEFIQDRKNALVVPYKNSEHIYEACIELLNNEDLRLQLIEQGKKDVAPFALQTFITKLEDLYLSL